ncbi:MAG: enoyl-CoA hydratase/isomerase family protein [Acidimicrobiales bacterium]|nr:enoyl-CoA hydratase/isomerase family protein [Acidimicrobiales bacterium]
MILEPLSADALLAELRSDVGPERSGAVRVALPEGTPAPAAVPDERERRVSLPFVVVGVTRGAVDDRWTRLCDVVVADGDPAQGAIEENLAAHPVAGTTLALLLRGQDGLGIGAGLVAESAAYSVLQSGPEFAAWRAAHPARPDRDEGPRVALQRAGGTLTITLTRPRRLNALDARMRDELVDACTLASADPSITRVELRGEGRAFCAGGDLDEFGTRADPATAHLIRLQRSVARALSRLPQDTVTHLHGACVGSGIELAAFTGTVVAARDTQISLPEIGLGLVPGAGGTVSLPRRIGRLRTAWLAFSGCTIDAVTAQEWGLVDVLEP